MTGTRPSRGEIWQVDLDPVQGHEQADRRPAVVVSVNGLNHSAAELVILLPITSGHKKVRSHVPVQPPEGGLGRTSYVKCEDVRSVSTTRLRKRVGAVAEETMRAIEDRLRLLLDLRPDRR